MTKNSAKNSIFLCEQQDTCEIEIQDIAIHNHRFSYIKSESVLSILCFYVFDEDFSYFKESLDASFKVFII